MLVHGKVVEHATSKSSRYGKTALAKRAMERLEGMDRVLFRAEMGCDCEGEVDGHDDHGTAV